MTPKKLADLEKDPRFSVRTCPPDRVISVNVEQLHGTILSDFTNGRSYARYRCEELQKIITIHRINVIEFVDAETFTKTVADIKEMFDLLK